MKTRTIAKVINKKFDDWFDFHNDAEDYRLSHGYEEDEDCEPPKPSPFSFTIKVPRVVL